MEDRRKFDFEYWAFSKIKIKPKKQEDENIDYKEGYVLDINEDKIDEMALALLYLTLHDDFRSWKQIDWEVMNRLHEKGMILEPVGKSKSVVFTDEGLKAAGIACHIGKEEQRKNEWRL